MTPLARPDPVGSAQDMTPLARPVGSANNRLEGNAINTIWAVLDQLVLLEKVRPMFPAAPFKPPGPPQAQLDLF